MASAYPQFERYLKEASQADWFRRARNPGQWLLWLWPAAVAVLVTSGAWLWLLPVAVLMIGGAWFLTGLHIKSFDRGRIFSKMYVDSYIAGRLRQALRKGQLQTSLGPEALDLLEQAAPRARKPMEAYYEAKLRGNPSATYLSAQADAAKTADGLMRAAIAILRGPLVHRRALDANEMSALRSISAQVEQIADESMNASRLFQEPEESEALRETLANLRAFQAAHEELNSIVSQSD